MFRKIDLRIFAAILYWSALGAVVLYGVIFILFAGSSLAPAFLNLPLLIQVACAGLVIATATFLFNMFRERARVFQACDRFAVIFAGMPPLTSDERAHGLSGERVEKMRSVAKGLTGAPAEWWWRLDETLEVFTNSAGGQGWFITRPVSESLPEQGVIDPIYHGSFHHAVPGLLTAMGLLATFASILIALAGVKYDPGNALRPVSGIDQLINGLSGKFLSSVIALVLSIAFGLLERKLCERQVYQRYELIVRRCQESLPFLSETRILLDMHRVAMDNARGSLGVVLDSGRWRA